MKVSQLRLAKCDNRSIVNQDFDPITRWILPGLPSGWSLYNFHFIVAWNEPPTVSGPFLMVRLIDFDYLEEPSCFSEEEIWPTLFDSHTIEEFENLRAVCAQYEQGLAAIFLSERPGVAVTEETLVWAIRPDAEGPFDESDPELNTYDVKRLRMAIRKYRGGSASIGGKGLTWGTSSIECYMSTTGDIFPGDVDAVLVDSDGTIRHVIELKKHTLPAPLASHLAGKYYPEKDKRKYLSFQAFMAHLNQYTDTNTPFSIFYYSTKQPEIRIQSVSHIDDDEIHVSGDTDTVSVAKMSDKKITDTICQWLNIQ